jgi:hypothetical protein
VTYPFKVTLGYFTDAATGRDSVRVNITNTSAAAFDRVELAWQYQVPDTAARQLQTQRIQFLHAEGEEGQPLGVGQRHTFVIPPSWLFQLILMVQSTPPDRSVVVASLDGRDVVAVRGENFEKLVRGIYPNEGRPEVDLPEDRVRYLSDVVDSIIEQGQAFTVYPPKEVTGDLAVLSSDDVAAKLDGTKWWLRFADSREELLNFRELMVLTFNVFVLKTRLTHEFMRERSPGKVSVSVTMAVPYVMTKEGVQALLPLLELEGVQR